jgi:hypothetical protein
MHTPSGESMLDDGVRHEACASLVQPSLSRYSEGA